MGRPALVSACKECNLPHTCLMEPGTRHLDPINCSWSCALHFCFCFWTQDFIISSLFSSSHLTPIPSLSNSYCRETRIWLFIYLLFILMSDRTCCLPTSVFFLWCLEKLAYSFACSWASSPAALVSIRTVTCLFYFLQALNFLLTQDLCPCHVVPVHTACLANSIQRSLKCHFLWEAFCGLC